VSLAPKVTIVTEGLRRDVRVVLRHMTEAEFASWRVEAVESFAADLARALDSPIDTARVRAAAQFEGEFAEGVTSQGHWVFVVMDADGAAVGTLWLGLHPQRPGAGFVYDLEIVERLRQRGYGRAAMLAAEEFLRAEGLTEIGLNVFGFNAPARHVYESLGYQITSIQMRKAIT
jgi:ribosomal protein S18 acetylase RimI-like enzyme